MPDLYSETGTLTDTACCSTSSRASKSDIHILAQAVTLLSIPLSKCCV